MKASPPQVVPDLVAEKAVKEEEELDMSLSSAVTEMVGDTDVQMLDTDSLEFDSQNLSMYENVELRQPPKIYENFEVNKKAAPTLVQEKEPKAQQIVAKDAEMDYRPEKPAEPEEAQNVSVRQLANKFETSPVEVPMAFDFNVSASKPMVGGSRKSESPKIPPSSIRAGKHFKDSNNSRSLDENAFIREFGGSKKFEHFTKSNTQIQEVEKHQVDGCSPNRRKSIELPKSLNPPKKLPDLKADGEVCKQQTQSDKRNMMELGKEMTKAEVNSMFTN